MAIFTSKDFSADGTLRVRNMVAAVMGVPAPATAQQCSDFVTYLLRQRVKEHEEGQQHAAVTVAAPD